VNGGPNPLEPLLKALEKYPQRVEVVPLRELVVESARENDKRPAFVKLHLPDEVVKGLRGRVEEQDLLLVVRVPREVLQRAESNLILPGDLR
jgi:hypothetical protein